MKLTCAPSLSPIFIPICLLSKRFLRLRRNTTAIWNLGDVVGYGANPNEVVDPARKLGGIVIRGNHDRACSDPATFSLHHRLNSTAATAAIWTDMVLTSENREWLLNLPPGPVKPLRRNLICVHGSSRNEDQYISSEYAAEAALSTGRARITLFGIRKGKVVIDNSWKQQVVGGMWVHWIQKGMHPRSLGRVVRRGEEVPAQARRERLNSVVEYLE